MVEYRGERAHRGIAVGVLREISAPSVGGLQFSKVEVRSIEDADAEIARFENALALAQEEVDILYDKAVSEVGRSEAELFRSYKALLADEGFLMRIRNAISDDRVNAEYAIYHAGKHYTVMFEEMNDPYMRARSDDMRDITERILQHIDEETDPGEYIPEEDLFFDEATEHNMISVQPDFILPGDEEVRQSAFSGNEPPDILKTETGSDFQSRTKEMSNRKDTEHKSGPQSWILLADGILPSDFIRLDKKGLSGIVLRFGSAVSHVAILAEALDIPVLIRTQVPRWAADREAILDANLGILIVDPDGDTKRKYEAHATPEGDRQHLLRRLRDEAAVTHAGHKVLLMGNITSAYEAAVARENGADGIGLFRTEYLYMMKNAFPTEDEQYAIYRAVAESMPGRDIVIRTFDLGGDKILHPETQKENGSLPYLYGDEAPLSLPGGESNPALGLRGIRFALTRRDIFRTQLKALLRAAMHGCIWIMFPMVTSVAEVLGAKEVLKEAQNELRAEQKPYGAVRVGSMIETPAGVFLAQELAREVDFFSIGTNDLTMYILAADRENPVAAPYYDYAHPAVMEAIRQVVRAGHAAGIPVAVCGESAGIPDLASQYIAMKIDALSVTPGQLLPMRAAVRAME